MMRWLVWVLERTGHPVVAVHERRPGRIVYADVFQVVAEPYGGARTR